MSLTAQLRALCVLLCIGAFPADLSWGRASAPSRRKDANSNASFQWAKEYGPNAVKHLRIGKDHKAIRASVNDITASGGDEPEPINEALRVVADMRRMGWTAGRRRVIILVGDSTIHASGRQQAFWLARQFAARMKGTINVIDVGGSGEQTKPRSQVQPDLRTIAKEGGGSAFLLAGR